MFRSLLGSALNELWEGFRELGERHPRLAPLLARGARDDIAQLVQSAAFALASIDERLEDADQRLLRPLVAHALPECLRPRPSSTILELSEGRTHAVGAQGKTFWSRARSLPSMPFRIMWPVGSGPYEIGEVRMDRPHATAQAIRLTLMGRGGATLGGVLPETLRCFLHLDPSVAIDVLHALAMSREPVEVTTFDANGEILFHGSLPEGAFRWVRVDTREPPLVSAPCDRFYSGTLLRDLFGFVESFLFFDLALGTLRGRPMHRVELTLPLGRVVEAASGLRQGHLRLFCAPATNEYEAPLEPLRASDGPEWTLAAAERPDAEILEVRALWAESREGRVPLISWERPSRPHQLSGGLVYYWLEQSLSRDETRTETRMVLATRERFRAAAPGTVIGGEVLASDGSLAESLGLGDVDGRNVTRISPAQRAIRAAHAMRINAYARMSPYRLAEPGHLAAFLGLHAPKEQFGPVQLPRFLHREHRIERRRLPDASWQSGDNFNLQIDTTGCRDSEAWLIGKLLSRALAERGDLLRFARLTMTRERARSLETFAKYEARDGERYSFPLG